MAWVGDLLFKSKILETGRQVGAEVVFAPGASEFAEADLFILDLSRAMDSLSDLRARFPAVPIVGYAGHLQVDLMKRAAELGCTSVLTNGQLAAQLPSLLANPSSLP